MLQRVLACCRDDRGAGALEFALITPVFMVLAFLVVQAGLYWEAQNVLNSVAVDTGRSARSYQSYPNVAQGQLPQQQQMATVGSTAVSSLVNDSHGINAGGLARGVGFGGIDSASWDTITVHITGKAINILTFIPLPDLKATATGPYEGFRPQPVGAP